MNAAERKQRIEKYYQGYQDLLDCLKTIPIEIWQFRPKPSDWSIHEILIHLADSETNSALRARMLITQPGGTLMAYDQDLWAKILDYHNQSWEAALEALKWARQTTHHLIKDLPEETWTHAVEHPEFEQPYTFDLWLKIYSEHVHGHIAQIKNNQLAWEQDQDL